MKRYIIISIILHILIMGVALFLVPEKKEKERKPFVATLVTPEEKSIEANPIEKKMTPREKTRQETRRDSNRIFAKEQNAPKVLSSVPSSPSAKKSPLGPRALTRELPSKGGQTRQMPDVGGDKGYSEGRGLQGSDKSPIPGQKQAPMREKLFDRDIIAKLSRKEQEGTKKNSSITFDTSEFKYYGYMQRLRDKIQNVWKYPQSAAQKGVYGDLYIEFTIKKTGKLGAVQLVRTSGYKDLDEAAIKALKDADPYWPLPDDIGEQSLTITGHFIYSLYGQYIR
ncbi:MAG: energy transducer TonB [Dissulfurispiraceae bacterium]